MKLYVLCALLMTAVLAEEEGTFQKCLEKDSISCMQMTVYRTAKSYFDKPAIEIFGGLSFVKSAESREGKSIEDNSIAVETAPTVDSRNHELETYFITNIKNFFQQRSLSFNFANAARSLANAIPEEFKSEMRGLVEEGRLKKRKLLKKLLPILAGLKIKFLLLGALSLFGLLLMAKKALFTSVLALGLALFSGVGVLGGQLGGGGGGGGFLSSLGGLFGGKSGGSGGYSGGWASPAVGGGYSAGWSGNTGWDSHGSYSSPVAQSIAYSGQKATVR